MLSVQNVANTHGTQTDPPSIFGEICHPGHLVDFTVKNNTNSNTTIATKQMAAIRMIRPQKSGSNLFCSSKEGAGALTVSETTDRDFRARMTCRTAPNTNQATMIQITQPTFPFSKVKIAKRTRTDSNHHRNWRSMLSSLASNSCRSSCSSSLVAGLTELRGNARPVRRRRHRNSVASRPRQMPVWVNRLTFRMSEFLSRRGLWAA